MESNALNVESKALNIATLSIPGNGGGNGKDVLQVGVIGYGYWGPNIRTELQRHRPCPSLDGL